MTVPIATLEPFVRQRTVPLTTFRRDGTPIGAPVSIAVDGDRAFVRTYDTAGKLKRIRHNPQVEVAPSTFRGTPTGPAFRARARALNGDEAAHAARLISRKHPILHGLLVPLLHRLRRNATIHIELTPVVGKTSPATPERRERMEGPPCSTTRGSSRPDSSGEARPSGGSPRSPTSSSSSTS